jgi:hypothetical protein
MKNENDRRRNLKCHQVLSKFSKYGDRNIGISCAVPARQSRTWQCSCKTGDIAECQPIIAQALRVRATISSHFGAIAGQADARRCDADDVVTSSRSGNEADADACPQPGHEGLRL